MRKETDACRLAYHLDEMAWVRWKSDAESSACALLAVSEAIAQDGEELNRLSRARVEGLFASLLIELRVDEQSGLDLADPDEESG